MRVLLIPVSPEATVCSAPDAVPMCAACATAGFLARAYTAGYACESADELNRMLGFKVL